jgi:hypothetical protein
MKIILFAVLALGGAAVAGMVAQASPSKTTIRVTEREFKITLSATHAPTGLVHFEIKNTGRFPHALAIAGPGVSKRTPAIRPGKSAVLTVTIRSGAYSLWCPMPGHAAQGMKATLNKAAKAGTTTTEPATTTDDGTTTYIPPGY